MDVKLILSAQQEPFAKNKLRGWKEDTLSTGQMQSRADYQSAVVRQCDRTKLVCRQGRVIFERTMVLVRPAWPVLTWCCPRAATVTFSQDVAYDKNVKRITKMRYFPVGGRSQDVLRGPPSG